MTTYEILTLLISLSGGWIAFMSVSLSVIFFLSQKK
ncbi:Holin [Sporosarcina sp. ANT_H38]